MMRLTYKDARGRWTLLLDGRERHGAAVDLLAAYEDTGLEPEDIRDAIDLFPGAEHIPAIIRQAEEEGRLVVLPCKLGTPIFRLSPGLCVQRDEDRCDSYCEGYDYSCPWFISTLEVEEGHFCLTDFTMFGETVFLTREEAAAALEHRKEKTI